MSRFLVVLVGLGLPVITGCSGGSTADGSPRVVGTPSSKPFPPKLRVLAEHFTVDIKASPNDFRDNVPLSQTLADLQATVLALQQIRSTDPAISAVAERGLSVAQQLTAGFERVNALPKPPSSGEILAESFIHSLYGNYFTPYAHALEADEQQRAILSELQGLIAALDQADTVHLLLPKLEAANTSGIRLLQKFAKTLASRRQSLLARYDHPISTGPLEAVNNKIRLLQRQAFGCRDFEFFRLKLYALHRMRNALVG